MLFNICGPASATAPPPPHLDAVTFRGIRYENAPIWLMNVHGQVRALHGVPRQDGPGHHLVVPRRERHVHLLARRPARAPKVLEHPLWNKGVVVQNEMMFHRGDPVGASTPRAIAQPEAPLDDGLRRRDDEWRITPTVSGPHLRPRGPPPPRALERRALRRHGRAEEGHGPHRRPHHRRGVRPPPRRHARKGAKVAEPSDPFHDTDFIQAVSPPTRSLRPRSGSRSRRPDRRRRQATVMSDEDEPAKPKTSTQIATTSPSGSRHGCGGSPSPPRNRK